MKIRLDSLEAAIRNNTSRMASVTSEIVMLVRMQNDSPNGLSATQSSRLLWLEWQYRRLANEKTRMVDRQRHLLSREKMLVMQMWLPKEAVACT